MTTTTPAHETFLSLDVVAARWDKHPRSVRRMISEGDLAAVRIGGSIRVALSEVQRAECAVPIGNAARVA